MAGQLSNVQMAVKIVEVKLIPNAKQERILNEGFAGNDQNNHYKLRIYVTQPAHQHRANMRLIELLAKHFNVRQSCIRIKSGLLGRVKTVLIEE